MSYISLHYGTEGGPDGPVKIKSTRQEVKEKTSKGEKKEVSNCSLHYGTASGSDGSLKIKAQNRI